MPHKIVDGALTWEPAKTKATPAAEPDPVSILSQAVPAPKPTPAPKTATKAPATPRAAKKK